MNLKVKTNNEFKNIDIGRLIMYSIIPLLSIGFGIFLLQLIDQVPRTLINQVSGTIDIKKITEMFLVIFSGLFILLGGSFWIAILPDIFKKEGS